MVVNISISVTTRPCYSFVRSVPCRDASTSVNTYTLLGTLGFLVEILYKFIVIYLTEITDKFPRPICILIFRQKVL
jgi:hypothetical protein